MRIWKFGFVSVVVGLFSKSIVQAGERPSILFRIADDRGWPHAGAYHDSQYKRIYQRAFAKRPSEERSNPQRDLHQLENVADPPINTEVKRKLAKQLLAELKSIGDPRVLGGGQQFDEFPYRRRIRRSQ